MSAPTDDRTMPHPRSPIRRFDVFAEYTRQERLDKGDTPEVANGYGIWLAKVVAARRFGAKTASSPDHGRTASGQERTSQASEFRSVGDELQTDETFDHEIVERMGPGFYEQVFVPAITEARAHGAPYEAMRDRIRKSWKPASPQRR